MTFRGVDYFAIDSLFSEQELLVRQTARRYSAVRKQDHDRQIATHPRFPWEL